jgi:glycerol-3-phosphate dehydrogenase
MNRERNLQRLADADAPWDVLVIGGGATGLGVAVDAASRGYRTALVEAYDFAKGTSSRSTKLAHGGVRYLRSGQIGLVRGALRERGLLERNAPHLVRRRAFIIPIYRRLDLPLYGIGLKAYEWLSGRLSFGASKILSVAETRRLLPNVKAAGLRGGVLYFDGQFDDARLALALAQTADAHGAAVVNYARVEALLRQDGRVCGARVLDIETGASLLVPARVVVNATGVFTDRIRQLDEPSAAPMLTVSSGVHLTLDRGFLPGEHALMIPKTSDGRVLFAVPWQHHVILGTTDEPRAEPETEPRSLDREIKFLLDHAADYFTKPPTRADVLSVFTGLRPLVRQHSAGATASLSRDHVIAVSPSRLVTITGGKWTSYRKMAEDTITRAAEVAALPSRPCVTATLRLHAATTTPPERPPRRFGHLGTEAQALEQLITTEPALGAPIHPRLGLRAADVVWAARTEMARTVEDVLARRSRALQLDARAALDAAPAVAALLARELHRDSGWVAEQLSAFGAVAHLHLAESETAANASQLRPA